MNSLFSFLCSYGNDGLPAVIGQLYCLNTSLTVFQCSYSTEFVDPCTSDNDDNDVSVSCCKFLTQ